MKKQTIAIARQIKEANPCADCGKFFPYYCMDFDHRDRSTKLGDMGHGFNNWHDFITELGKCDVVCVLCHRIRTHNKWDYNKNPGVH